MKKNKKFVSAVKSQLDHDLNEMEELDEISTTANIAGYNSKNFIGKVNTDMMKKNGYEQVKRKKLNERLNKLVKHLDLIRKKFNF